MAPKILRSLCVLASLASVFLAGCGKKSETPSSEAPHHALRVGFAQTGAESAWRTANTASMKNEAVKRGIDLKFADGQSKQENQIRALRSFVAQGVDAIVLAPIVVTGWDPVLQEAKQAHIPVVIMDRKVQTNDPTLYAMLIGSDFYREGKMAVDWIAQHADGRTKIVEIQGEPGSAAANERHRAFAEEIAHHPEFQVLDSQTGNFRREEGRQVMEALLKKHGHDIQILFSHNDDMAIGAIQAIEAAGLKPGSDIMVVSIDAIHEALQAIVDGKMNCSVECNPLFGPKIYPAIEKIVRGEPVPREIYNQDQLFDRTNAAEALPHREY